MRIPAVLLSALLVIAACNNSDTSSGKKSHGVISDTMKRTTMEWTDSTRDFGTISEGQKLEVSFGFRNTGEQPLVFLSITPSCGCTVVEKPEKPVMPGGSGTIKGVFDSAGKPGIQHKSIHVMANTEGSGVHTLEFTVKVEAAPAKNS